MSERDTTRRRFLQVTGGAGVVTLAGCLGDDEVEEDPLDDEDVGDDDDAEDADYHIRWGTSTGGTMDVGLAVEAGVSEVSDTLAYDTIESPGYIGTTYRLNDDEFDGGIVDTNTLNNAQLGMGDFDMDPVDKLPWQGFLAFPYSIYVMAREDTDIYTFDDLAGATVYPAEPGFSTRATTLQLWEEDPIADIYDEMEIVDMDVADAPGAMGEGAIDAAIAYGTPGIGNTGWVVEYDARTDVRYVEHTDALVEAIEGFDGVGMSEFDDGPGEFAWDQDVGADEFVTWDLNITYVFHPDTPDGAAYELTRIAAEENDVIRESDERFTPTNAEELLQGALPNYPFHPGAAEYYQDEGVWNEDWVIGDRDQVGEYFE